MAIPRPRASHRCALVAEAHGGHKDFEVDRQRLSRHTLWHRCTNDFRNCCLKVSVACISGLWSATPKHTQFGRPELGRTFEHEGNEMKKVLLATSALVASAGIAAADVSITGFAEMGIADDGSETQFHTDIDATFNMSGETDGGLTFGASIDIDETDDSDAFGASTQGGETIFISGGFGTLTMGDTDGAFDWALQEAAIGGSIADDHTAHAGYNGNAGLDGTYDGQIARYDYSFGDFAVGLSAEIDDTGVGDTVIGVGFKWSTDLGGVDLGVGLGYQEANDSDIAGISLDASFAGGFRGILNYSTRDDAGVDTDHIGLALGYTMDALTVAVTYGNFDTAGVDVDGWGLAVDYDLGGGAELQFGYGDSDGGTDTWSFGVAMSF